LWPAAAAFIIAPARRLTPVLLLLLLQTPAGWDFGKTQTDFVTLLSPGILNGTHRWLVRARLWRLVLSQSVEGWWDAGGTTAFVLESRAAAETKDLPATLRSRVLLLLGSAAAAAAAGGNMDGMDGRHEGGSSALDDALDDGDRVHVRASTAGVEDAESDPSTPRASQRRSESMSRAAALDDCPLSCSVRAITSSMPRRLAAVHNAYPYINVERVWTTMLCICVLERMNACWIWGDGCVRCTAAYHRCFRWFNLRGACPVDLRGARPAI
jgi:hypothetical protein